jgi:GNAT superfamily N-acetyltransferase
VVTDYELTEVQATMPLVIRQAGPADAPVIVEYNQQMAQETEDKKLDRAVLLPGVEKALHDPNKGRYFLAVDGTETLGQMMITYEWSDWRNGWIWWIQSVYVRADARRRGVFKALYDHVSQAAKQSADVVALRLYVERHNEVAKKTYLRLGMAITDYDILERYPL